MSLTKAHSRIIEDLPNAVNSIADLKAHTTDINSIEVLGYYEAGDGGGGSFYWDATSTEADNGGTIIAADDGGTGRWKRVYSGAVNVKWFGAKDDGTSIRTPFQEALKVANKGVLEIPHGTYAFDANLVITNIDEITIIGDNATIEATSVTTDWLWRFESVDFFKMEGLNFDGKLGNAERLVRVINLEDRSMQRAIVENCSFYDVHKDDGSLTPTGLGFVGSFESINVRNCRFENIRNTAASGAKVAKGCVVQPYWLDTTQSPLHTTVEGCEFIDIAPTDDADGVHSSNHHELDSTFTVRDCKFKNCHKRGVKSQVIGKTIVEACTFEYTDVIGVNSIDFQYGGGIAQNNTWIVNNEDYYASACIKLDRYTASEAGAFIRNNLITGDVSLMRGQFLKVEPENGLGNIGAVTVDGLDSYLNLNTLVEIRGNTRDIGKKQVESVTLKNISIGTKLSGRGLNTSVFKLDRGQQIVGESGFSTLNEITIENFKQYSGNDVSLLSYGTNTTGHDVDLMGFYDVIGVTTEGLQLSYRKHTLTSDKGGSLILNPTDSGIHTRSTKFNSNFSFTFDAATVNTTNNTITVTSHGRTDGDLFTPIANGNTLPTGIDEKSRLYIEVIDSDTLKFHTTITLDNEVDISATGTGTINCYQLHDIFSIDWHDGASGSEIRQMTSSVICTWNYSRPSYPGFVQTEQRSFLFSAHGFSDVYRETAEIHTAKHGVGGAVSPSWLFAFSTNTVAFQNATASIYFTNGIGAASHDAVVPFFCQYLGGICGSSTNFQRSSFQWKI